MFRPRTPQVKKQKLQASGSESTPLRQQAGRRRASGSGKGGRQAGRTAAGQPAAAARPQVAAQSAESRSIPNERPSAERNRMNGRQRDRQPKSQGDSALRSYGDRNQETVRRGATGDRNQGDRPQRSYGGQEPGRPPAEKLWGQEPGRPPAEKLWGQESGRPPAETIRGQESGDRPQRPYGDRNQGDRPQRPYGTGTRETARRDLTWDRNQGDRPQRPYRGQEPGRPSAETLRGQEPGRPSAETLRGQEPGDRPQRPTGTGTRETVRRDLMETETRGTVPDTRARAVRARGTAPGTQAEGRNDRKDGDNRGGFGNRSRGPRTDRDKKPETTDLGPKKPQKIPAIGQRQKQRFFERE